MKKETKTFGIFAVLFVILILISIVTYVLKSDTELVSEGELATDFCTEKCGDLDYYSSLNNSKYNFIKCECVTGFKDSYGYGGGRYPEVEERYYDSQTFEKITKEDIDERINEKR